MRPKKWVIKVGSNSFCKGGPLLVRDWMQQVHCLKTKYNLDIIWVTSGAIASARERLSIWWPHSELKERTKEKVRLAEKQALSAIGQPFIMELYNLALQSTGLFGAQILLTYDDLSTPSRKRNFHNALDYLLNWNIIPILNENDAVATEEIRFGDNDSLSAKVASVVRASRLVLLTDVEGFFDDNRMVSRIDKITSLHLSRVKKNQKSERGTGGMYSKLLAAQEATRSGVETWLVKADLPSVLIKVAENQCIGTRIGK